MMREKPQVKLLLPELSGGHLLIDLPRFRKALGRRGHESDTAESLDNLRRSLLRHFHDFACVAHVHHRDGKTSHWAWSGINPRIAIPTDQRSVEVNVKFQP